jgi:uncharacterized protein involved in outer membrane biogenesis
MKKTFSVMIATALVLLTIVFGAVSMSLGRIVKSAVEAAGPRVLGVPVTLGLVTISPWSGSGTLRGLVIGNPDGFKAPHAISVGSVEVEVKLSSLLTDTIVVERVAVREPELIWEIGEGSSNISRLQRNAQEAAARYGGEGSQAPRKMSDPAKKGKSLLIRDFSVTGGKVGLSATALGAQGLAAPLPDVRLTNLGGKDRSPAQVAAQAFGAITSSAQGAVSNLGGKAIDAARDAAMKALGSFLKRSGK